MRLLPLVSLLVYTFGAITFAELAVYWVRSHWRTRIDAAAATSGALALVFPVWFVVNVASVLADLAHGSPYYLLATVLLFQSSLFAPLLMQSTYLEHRQLIPSKAAWRAALIASWAAAMASMATIVAVRFSPSTDLVIGLFVTLCALFIGAAIFNLLIVGRAGRGRITPDARKHHVADIVLWVLTATLIGIGLSGGPGTWMPDGSAIFQLLLRSTPIFFVLAGTYFERRITFFDLFVKRGALVLAGLTLLTLYFAIVAPVIERFPIRGAIVWLHAIAMLPLVGLMPWLQRHIGAWIDRHWLGRRFTATEATAHLFDGLQSAISEPELVAAAQTRLGEIFQAPVSITTEFVRHHENVTRTKRSPDDIAIEFKGEEVGRIRLGARRDGAVYLSQDLALVHSLSDIIGSMLENVRLQSRRREQLAVEQELRLHASRSELKALRAQINPHFLFNALNAIVALIPTKPERAEETLEQLAEVFRYTLTRSDKEWARLADEVDFVRAYLDVEKARFGDRLQSTIEVDSHVLDVKVPSMMLQTLVENAVKHGLSSVRGIGVLSIDARADGDRVRIVVRDNGAGPDANGRRQDVPSPAGEGYGLRNIRERLAGHFGDRASFSLTRDPATGTTVAAIDLPSRP